MQPRLTRSRNEVIIAGVCGGLAEYFVIDPVIVRLIFVLVTLTSGIGLLVYPILWMVMPKGGAPAPGGQPLFPADAEEWRRRAHAMGEEAAHVGQQIGREVREVLLREQHQHAHRSAGARPPAYADEPPPPHAYNFDPLTGQPLHPQGPTTGQTVNLNMDAGFGANELSAATQPPTYAPAAAPRPKRWRWLGFVLIGFGALILSDYLGIPTDIVFPLIMIIAGVMLLRRR